jgi:hypothetical protein
VRRIALALAGNLGWAPGGGPRVHFAFLNGIGFFLFGLVQGESFARVTPSILKNEITGKKRQIN